MKKSGMMDANTENELAAASALGVSIVAALTLCGAWFFQYVLGIVPCPLCLEQRYAYYLLIPLGVVLALAARRGLPRGALVVGLIAMAVAALANAGLGAYHSGVEWGFWPGPDTCSGARVDLGRAGSLLDNLDKVKVVRCDEVQWRFLGLSLAGYNVLISLAMAAIALAGAATLRRRR